MAYQPVIGGANARRSAPGAPVKSYYGESDYIPGTRSLKGQTGAAGSAVAGSIKQGDMGAFDHYTPMDIMISQGKTPAEISKATGLTGDMLKSYIPQGYTPGQQTYLAKEPSTSLQPSGYDGSNLPQASWRGQPAQSKQYNEGPVSGTRGGMQPNTAYQPRTQVSSERASGNLGLGNSQQAANQQASGANQQALQGFNAYQNATNPLVNKVLPATTKEYREQPPNVEGPITKGGMQPPQQWGDGRAVTATQQAPSPYGSNTGAIGPSRQQMQQEDAARANMPPKPQGQMNLGLGGSQAPQGAQQTGNQSALFSQQSYGQMSPQTKQYNEGPIQPSIAPSSKTNLGLGSDLKMPTRPSLTPQQTNTNFAVNASAIAPARPSQTQNAPSPTQQAPSSNPYTGKQAVFQPTTTPQTKQYNEVASQLPATQTPNAQQPANTGAINNGAVRSNTSQPNSPQQFGQENQNMQARQVAQQPYVQQAPQNKMNLGLGGSQPLPMQGANTMAQAPTQQATPPSSNPYGSQQGANNTGAGGNQYGGSNPYLQQNIDKSLGDISRQYNNTIAPQRAGAMARSGSFGNSGQQAMQLEDQRNLGETMANTSSQMRMADYTQQQSMYQQDQQNNTANRGLDLTQRGQDLNQTLGMAGVDTQRYGIDTGASTTTRGQDIGERVSGMQDKTNRYGMDSSAAASRYGADASASASRYGADSNAATSRYGVDASERNAQMTNQTNLRGQDQSYNLGIGQIDATTRGQDVNERIANANNTTQRYGMDQQAETSRYGTDAQMYLGNQSNATNRYGMDQQAETSRYGTDANTNIANQSNWTQQRGQDVNERVANQSNATNRYGMDQQAATSRYGTDANTNIAYQANQTQQRGQDFNRDIANQSNETTMRGQDNSYNLGLGQNENQSRSIDNQFTLGQQQNENQLYGYDTQAETSRYGADSSAGASRYGSDASRDVGMNNSNNSYDLGLRQNDYNYAQLDSNIYNSNFQNQLNAAQIGLSVDDQLQKGNNLGLNAGTQIQNTPLNYQTQFNNAGNAAGGLGGQNSQQMPGDPLTGAMAGYQLANAYTRYM